MADVDPIIVGVLLDHAGSADTMIELAGMAVADVVAEGRLDRPIVFVSESAIGLPRGTAAAVETAFARLVDAQVLLVLGPAITDNGLIVRDLADAAHVPCINWTGSELTRSEWMFHYQVGSLEEEPHLLARYLHGQGHHSVVLVQDRSPIGERYGSFFEEAAARTGIDVVAKIRVSPIVDDLGATVERLRRHDSDALVYLGLGLSAHPLGAALAAGDWHPAVVTNSALMYGYANPEWRALWDGWTYVDAWSEDNPRLQALLDRTRGSGRLGAARPMSVASGYDMGRLVAEGAAGAAQLTRSGIKDALERLKLLPAALGTPDTQMGFGRWDRGALKGGYLVLRRWRDGESVPAEV